MNKKPKIKKKYNPWFFLGVGFYMSAFAIWLQGYPNMPLCNPDSIIQPHGICTFKLTSNFIFFFSSELKKNYNLNMKSLGLGFGYFCIYTTPIQLFLLDGFCYIYFKPRMVFRFKF